MGFLEWISLREGEPAQRLDRPPMRVVGVPMSQSGFFSKEIKHGEYQSKNFDRYPFKPDEKKALEYVEKMSRIVHGDMQVCIEALAGYYENDGIVKAYDDFLTKLGEMKIKV